MCQCYYFDAADYIPCSDISLCFCIRVCLFSARSNCALIAAVGTLCIDRVSMLVDHVPCFEYHLNKSISAISRADADVPHWFRFRREMFDVGLSYAFISLQGMYSSFLFI